MVNRNALVTFISFEITLRRITVMWDDAQVSERWAIDERKGGYYTSSPISFHYPIFFIQSLTRKWHFLDKYSSYFPCQMNWIRNTSRQIVVAMLYMDCIYRRNLKLNFCSFFYWFSLWVSQFFMSLNIRHKNCVIYVYFSVFIGRKCCVHTCIYRRFTSAGMRDTCIWTLM